MTTKKPTETMSNIDNYVLAKLLLEHFCGLGQTLVYTHYNVSDIHLSKTHLMVYFTVGVIAL